MLVTWRIRAFLPAAPAPRSQKKITPSHPFYRSVNGFYKKMPDMKGKFYEHGSAMLRFECEWREIGETFGDRRSFALQYYLADVRVMRCARRRARARAIDENC